MVRSQTSSSIRPSGRSIKAVELYEAGQFEEAARACRNILMRNRRDLVALQVMAAIENRRCDFRAAAHLLERCVAIRPNDAVLHCSLATAQRQQGFFEKALTRYEESLRRRPDYGLALAGKAVALNHLGRIEAARAVLAPFVEQATETHDMAATWGRLEYEAGRYENAIDVAQRHLGVKDIPAETQSQLYALLGDCFERTDRVDEAFEAFSNARKCLAIPVDPNKTLRDAQMIESYFSADRLASLACSTCEDDSLIFIVGMLRSGSTLIEQIIHAHPKAFGVGEDPLIHSLVQEFRTASGTQWPYPKCLDRFSRAHAEQFAANAVKRTRCLAPESERLINKNLGNFHYLGLLSKVLPGARAIYCKRDPIDTCMSCFTNTLDPVAHPYVTDLRALGVAYRSYEKIMDHWLKELDWPILVVQYEELVEDQKAQTKRILEFCRMEWDDQCLQFHAARRAVATLSYDQVRRPLYSSSIGRAGRFRKFLGPLRDGLGMTANTNAEVDTT